MTNETGDIDTKRWSSLDGVIAQRAERQYGVVSRDQLRAIGLTDEAIRGRLRAGRLHCVYRGVYAVGHRRIGIDGWRLAAVLTYGDDAVISNRAAGAHWNLRQSSAIEVTVPRTVRRRSGVVVHTVALPADEVTVHEGIPTTTVARTIFDLAPLGDTAVKQAMAKAEYLQLTDTLSLAAVVERHGSRPHAGVIRRVLADYQAGQGITTNEFEEAFDDFLQSRGFPPAEKNAWIQLGKRWIRGDFVFRPQRVIVETDGGIHRTVFGQRSDHARDRAARLHDWTVLRVGWWALHHEADEVAADLQRALDR